MKIKKWKFKKSWFELKEVEKLELGDSVLVLSFYRKIREISKGLIDTEFVVLVWDSVDMENVRFTVKLPNESKVYIKRKLK